jgi:hypothetical protein
MNLFFNDNVSPDATGERVQFLEKLTQGPVGPMGPQGVRGEKGDKGATGGGSTEYIVQSDFSSPYNYIGRAVIGTDNSSSSWSIARIEIASDGSTTKLNATGSWNNRASLSYT